MTIWHWFQAGLGFWLAKEALTMIATAIGRIAEVLEEQRR